MKQSFGSDTTFTLFGKDNSQEMWSDVDYSLNCDEEFQELSKAAALQELYDSETEKEIWIRKLLPSSKELENGKHEFATSCSELSQSVVENDSTKELEKITKETDHSAAQLVKLDGLQSLIDSSATWDDEDRKAYSEFLLSLYAPEDKDYGPEDSSDEDFDYLLEAQNETEDEEEYRNDPAAKISGKELVDLVSGKSSYSFRSKKCHYMKNTMPKKKPRMQVRQLEEQPIYSSVTPHYASEVNRATPIMPADVQFSISQFNSRCSQFYFQRESLEQISLQISRHIQLLIQICLLVGQERLRDDDVLHLSRKMLNEWKQASDICVNYRKFFREAILGFDTNSALGGCTVSLFDKPTLHIVPDLLSLTEQHDCLKSSDAQKLMETLAPYFEEDLFPKLPKYNFYIRSKHSILDAQYVDVDKVKSMLSSEDQWSSAEDGLLATLIREYGSDWLENYERLLPSKQYDEVWRRYRFLSGRHAPDNPVKRLVIERQKPLSSEEWRILEHGVYLYGDNAWKQIETNLLPHRDQIILQRMWKQRQKRRRQKIRENERHKQEARKLARRLRQQALEEDQKELEREMFSKYSDKEVNSKETNRNGFEVSNCSNWLVVNGDTKVHFSREDDKKLLSQVKAFGATESTFVALAKILGNGKTPEVVRKRYSQLLWWLQKSSNSIQPSSKKDTCESSCV